MTSSSGCLVSGRYGLLRCGECDITCATWSRRVHGVDRCAHVGLSELCRGENCNKFILPWQSRVQPGLINRYVARHTVYWIHSFSWPLFNEVSASNTCCWTTPAPGASSSWSDNMLADSLRCRQHAPCTQPIRRLTSVADSIKRD